MGPLKNDPSPAFNISKTANGNGTYTIDFRGGCDNIFGCIPDLTVAKANFNRFVMQ